MTRAARLGLRALLAFIGCWALPVAADDFRLWQEGDVLMLDRSQWQASMGWKLASEPSSSRLQAWEWKPKLQRRWGPRLDSALTYKWVRARRADDWVSAHAVELDLSSSWQTGELVRTRFTNRLGIAQAATGDLFYRYHAIPKVEWPAQWLPAQTAADASLEVVYDLRTGRWHESKLTPLRLKFRSGRNAYLLFSYVLNHKNTLNAGSQRDHVLVLAVTYDVTPA